MSNIITRYLFVLIIIFGVFFVSTKNIKNRTRRLIFCGFFACLIALLSITLSGSYQRFDLMLAEAARRIREMDDISFKLFYDTYYLYYGYGLDYLLFNLVGNILLFIPLGFGFVALWKKHRRFSVKLGFALLFPLFIETYQLMIKRTWDIDDLMFNGVGIALGYMLYRVLKKKLNCCD